MSNFYSNFGNGYNGLYTQAKTAASFAPVNSDFGPVPFITDINKATLHNNNYRTALWTGDHLQVTLMSIPVGGDIGLEVHTDTDQFLRVEKGQGLAVMGDARDRLTLQLPVFDDSAVFVPAGTWHNISNTGSEPLKIYTIYAPAHHPKGTIHQTKAAAEAAER